MILHRLSNTSRRKEYHIEPFFAVSAGAVTATVFLILIYSNKEKQYSARSRQGKQLPDGGDHASRTPKLRVGLARNYGYGEGIDRKRLGLPYNRIKKGCSRLPAQPAPSLTRADYKWYVKLGLSITSEAVDRDSPEQKSFESEP